MWSVLPGGGDFFERMVQLMKRCLRKLVGRAKLSYDELYTSVTEVEAILNSRPLTYVSASDLDEPLTPSHLIMGKRLLSVPDHLCHSEDSVSDPDYAPVTRTMLTRRSIYLHTILQHFWTRWRREYLLELRESHRRSQGHGSIKISIGDVVIIHDDTPRGMWRLGLVKEKLQGRDGECRGAIVSGQGPSSFMRRPLQRLFPLEVCQQDNTERSTCETEKDHSTGNTPPIVESSTEQESSQSMEQSIELNSSSASQENQSSISTEENISTRPRRCAATEARDRIIAKIMDNQV